MLVTAEQSLFLLIELDEPEAIILKGLVQNPPEDCDPEDYSFCVALFEALKGKLPA